MNKSWTIKIPIRPMGSPRPRFVRQKNFVKTYMPSNYENYKKQLAVHFPKLNLEGPIKIDILFFFKVAKSLSKKKKKKMLGNYHTCKPDKDNLEKSVLDAMNMIIFKDDAQVVDGRIAKFWASNDLIIIRITKLEEES